MQLPKIGDKIYVDSHYYISHGSDDVEGGIATVSGVDKTFVETEEHPGHAYNWKFLGPEQEGLKKKFGASKAHACPDIDTPFIEEGDFVNGKKYKGPPIW